MRRSESSRLCNPDKIGEAYYLSAFWHIVIRRPVQQSEALLDDKYCCLNEGLVKRIWIQFLKTSGFQSQCIVVLYGAICFLQNRQSVHNNLFSIVDATTLISSFRDSPASRLRSSLSFCSLDFFLVGSTVSGSSTYEKCTSSDEGRSTEFCDLSPVPKITHEEENAEQLTSGSSSIFS